FPKRYITSQ
ncbi:unnamed protein product, partial [Allacma fusca]